MAPQESEVGVAVDVAGQPDHDCPYLAHVERLLHQAGSDLGNWSMSTLVRNRINNIHVDGECPPTHPGGDMTKPGIEWSDHVKTYSSPRSVL